MRALIVAVMLCSACSSLVAASPDATSETAPLPSTPSPAPSATPSPSATDIAATSSPAGSDEFKFIRWTGGYKILAAEPGGPVSASQDVHIEMVASVVDTVMVDGIEWIRVQYGSERPGDWAQYGWAPAEGDIDRAGGIHVSPVYEYVVPDCPEEPTIADLSGMTPLHGVYCYGSRMLTFSPVLMRHEVSELDYHLDGEPSWLAIGQFIANWVPEFEERGATSVYVDPASGVELPENTWFELTGQLDYPVARTCSMTSTEPEILDVTNHNEAVALCRGHFVVTGARQLSEGEIPEDPSFAPGPEPSSRVTVATRRVIGPATTRYWSASVWTGTQLLVWGGWDGRNNDRAVKDGFAYTPATGEWGPIPDAPIASRGMAEASWTGAELLIWGGENGYESALADGAAYNPSTMTWRKLANAPLSGGTDVGSTWTGTEWWVAAGNRSGATDIAAYDPATDSWRSLPSIPDEFADTPSIAWSGSEALLLTAAGLFSMPTDGAEWVAEVQPTELQGPAIWTGDQFVALASTEYGSDPLASNYLTYPVSWDPTTRSIVELALPPRNVYDPVQAGSRLAFFDEGLALDLTTDSWVTLDLDEEAIKALELAGNTSVWAEDRLLVWGGVETCGEPPPKFGTMFELIPEWDSDQSTPTPLARRVSISSDSADPRGAANPTSVSFAC